jgi:hypothetical protein
VECSSVGAVYDRALFLEMIRKRAVIDRAYSSDTISRRRFGRPAHGRNAVLLDL